MNRIKIIYYMLGFPFFAMGFVYGFIKYTALLGFTFATVLAKELTK